MPAPRRWTASPIVGVAALLCQAVLIVRIVWTNTTDAIEAWTSWGDRAARPPLYGAYFVDTFVRNGAVVAPTLAEEDRWRWFTVARADRILVQRISGATDRYDSEVEDREGKITLTTRASHPRSFTLMVTNLDADHMMLRGNVGGDELTVGLERRHVGGMLLDHGWHWVNEFPNNH